MEKIIELHIVLHKCESWKKDDTERSNVKCIIPTQVSRVCKSYEKAKEFINHELCDIGYYKDGCFFKSEITPLPGDKDYVYQSTMWITYYPIKITEEDL